MDYPPPQYTREEVDAAGKLLASTSEVDPHAYAVADNWRAAHQYPLNAISVVLKGRARRVNSSALVFQRVKRFPSILYKLRKRPWITLSKMQDLGGCRAVLKSSSDVLSLREMYLEKQLSHVFVRETNYIEKPKKDGYRGVHLIYSFRGTSETAAAYAKHEMQIEIQMRSQLQHYWATAVETAETFTKEAIKSRPKVDQLSGWEEFFALVSSCFAREEGQPNVPDTPENMDETISRLRQLEGQEYFTNKLETFKLTAEEISTRNKARYFLLDLDTEARRLRIRGFKPLASREANEALISKEQETIFADLNAQQVLVTVDDVAQLKRAYPNYYLDTTQFVKKVRDIIA